jgi:putative transposase
MYDSTIHHRRSIRLRGYDYSCPGNYFVTICAHEQLHLFGQIVEGEMDLNDVGQMVQSIWTQMPNHYPNCQVDAFVVMPNHVHGIIVIEPRVVAEPDGGEGHRARPSETPNRRGGPPRPPECRGRENGRGQAQGPAPTLSLGDLIHRFKSLTTARYRQGIATHGWPALNGRLWQRNYYEHIVRNHDELQKIREYIATNPVRWETDWENIMRSS